MKQSSSQTRPVDLVDTAKRRDHKEWGRKKKKKFKTKEMLKQEHDSIHEESR